MAPPEPPGPLQLAPLISVIIPVWREPAVAEALAALEAQGYPEWEAWVADGDGGSSLKDVKHPRLRPLLSPRAGRGHQLRHGASQAQGEILLFLHADTRLPARGLHRLAELLRTHPELAGGAFDLGIAAPGWAYRMLENGGSWRSRLTRLPYGDQAVFVRRSAYWAVGGFPDVPLMEDVGLAQRLKRAGYRLGFLNERVQTSARRWQQEGLVFTTARNLWLLGRYLSGSDPVRLVRHYRASDSQRPQR
ncbi:MAG: TIGR04283 family arsenosugar biosynthesis glycosyltransferase [Candidatus Sericytochromatia bacterium]